MNLNHFSENTKALNKCQALVFRAVLHLLKESRIVKTSIVFL